MPATSPQEKLIIFDTTLRDGEQSPGVTLNTEEKVEIAKHLSRLGVDVLEAGFPVASQGDFDAVQRIAAEVGPLMEGRSKIGKPMIIAGLSRATPSDIKRCAEAISPAPLKRIHTFLATSDIHLEYKLKISREECIKRACAAVELAKSLCGDVEFSPEDAGRSDRDFLCEVLGKVIEAGATTLNIPDTVGYNTPEEYGALMKHLIANTKGSDKVTWSTHCHNDLGLATANTLAGVSNGARQVEVTINGIGERAGNTAMEEVVMAIHTHPHFYPVYHTINTQLFFRISQLVSSLSGMMVQSNKAIVGRNAFLHESGIHQDGVLKNKLTYEIITPETVGVTDISLVLGKHSGRNAFRERCKELGFSDLSDTEFQKAFESFKALCDRKKKVTDADILQLITSQISTSSPSMNAFYQLDTVQVYSGSHSMATATVKLVGTRDKIEYIDAGIGRGGPIEAVFEAVQRIVQRRFRLLQFEVRAVGEGIDALGKVDVKIASESAGEKSSPDAEPKLSPKPTYHGQGTNTDIILASATAYVNAINILLSEEEQDNIANGLKKSRHSVADERKVDV